MRSVTANTAVVFVLLGSTFVWGLLTTRKNGTLSFYLPAGMRASTFLGNWVMRSSIPDTNFGVWAFTICRMPGPNSCRMLIPASLPIVVPKLLNVAEVERAQYGR